MDAESIISKFGDQPLFSLTLKDFLTVTKSVAEVPEKVEKFYTRRDLMEKFNVSYPTIIEHEKRGLLTSGKRIGHKHLYSQEDVDNYLNRIPKR